MMNSKTIILFLFLFFLFLHAKCSCDIDAEKKVSFLVRKNERRSVVETEYGEISAVDLSDGTRTGRYHLQFFTLEPNSLFLPVLLHADMILYVKTGSGSLYWSPGDEDVMTVSLQKGDVYRVPPGSVFFLKCDLQPEREKLRIHAIFTNEEDEHTRVTSIGAYSSIAEMVRGFDKTILQSAFMASAEVIEAIMSSKTEAIVHMPPTTTPKLVHLLNWEISFLRTFGGARPYNRAIENKKKHKKKKEVETFNVLNEDPDFENCNGWSMTVTKKDLPSLKNSNIGVLYVNLTKGSMMGPHWNPKASEITVVVKGQGMIRVVCPSSASMNECKNVRFRVEEGDVFAIPRFHPMAQMSFNNDSLVLVGFSTSAKTNHPQFLAGKTSVLQVLDKQILAAAFKVSNTTITQLLVPQNESIILDCTSCAEYEELRMHEEIEKEEEEEREKEKEEEAKRREEERERKEEEAKKKKEEEEAKQREEEEREGREKEEAKKREEEERERREREEEKEREEEVKQKEEEERERREREEEKEREEEAKQKEEEAKQKEEERERRQREEEKKQEEEAKKKEEQEEERKREEEKETEETRKQEEEEKETKRREEEERGKEHGETEEEAAKRQEKERQEREQEQGGEEGESEGKETKRQEQEKEGGETEPEEE